VKGVDGIIHVAAPVRTTFENGEKEAIMPDIEGTKALLSAAATESKIKLIVLTYSFATVIDVSRISQLPYTATAEDWNPVTYEEAKASNGITAYRGAKKFSELYAWDYVRDHKPHFDLAVILPPLVFGPVVHPVAKVTDLNDSNSYIWTVAFGHTQIGLSRSA